jgi:hypothetical protein
VVTKDKPDLATIVKRWLKTIRLNKTWKVEQNDNGDCFITFLTSALGNIQGIVVFGIENQAIHNVGDWTNLNPVRLEAADPEFFPKLREILDTSAEAAKKEISNWGPLGDVKPRAFP